MAGPLSVDFISDVICPWCFIGFTRLEKAIAATGVEADVTLRPFQLDPSTPPEDVDLRERLAKKYGVDPERMFDRVEAAARESGIPLDFAKVRRTPNTLKPHVLRSASGRDLRAGDRARTCVRRAPSDLHPICASAR